MTGPERSITQWAQRRNTQLTLNNQRDGDGRLARCVLGQTSVGSRVSVRNSFDQQDSSSVTKRLGDELSVHRQLLSVESPLDGQRRVALEDVTGERDIITGVQGLFNPIHAKLGWYCKGQRR